MNFDTIVFDDGSEYVESSIIINKAPKFSKYCRNGAELVKKHGIEDFIYMRYDKEDKLWYNYEVRSFRYDKLFISLEYIKSNESLMNELKYNEDDNEHAPDIIVLEEHEMFRDNEGKTYDVETRGIREKDKIFFSLDDVAKCFEIPSLRNTIIDSKASYVEDIDYKYFIVNQKKRTMFLTYNGLLKLQQTSRTIRAENKYTIHIWLSSIVPIKNKKFKIKNVEKVRKMNGYVYCITSPILNAVKIGYWRSSLTTLRRRYITSYGPDINIRYVYTRRPEKLEKKCHSFFNEYKIKNELFKKDFLDEYYRYLENNIQEPIVDEEDINDNDNTDDDGDNDNTNNYTYINECLKRTLNNKTAEMELELTKKDLVIKDKEILIQSKETTIQKQENELLKRDTKIKELERRVKALEKKQKK